MAEFEPRIVAFLCNWCTYTGADLTRMSPIADYIRNLSFNVKI